MWPPHDSWPFMQTGFSLVGCSKGWVGADTGSLGVRSRIGLAGGGMWGGSSGVLTGSTGEFGPDPEEMVAGMDDGVSGGQGGLWRLAGGGWGWEAGGGSAPAGAAAGCSDLTPNLALPGNCAAVPGLSSEGV